MVWGSPESAGPPSRCGAAGSARRLGACDRLMSRPSKARKISVFLAFSRFSAAFISGKKLLTTDLTTYGFDSKNLISGCRVTVTRLLWEQVQAGSTPVIPTKNQPKMRFFAPLSADFLLIIDILPPLWQICLTAEKRLVSHLQHKPLYFFGKSFLCLLRCKICFAKYLDLWMNKSYCTSKKTETTTKNLEKKHPL